MARRAVNTGSVTKRPDGRWEVRITLPAAVKGEKRKRKSFYASSEKEARAMLARLRWEIQDPHKAAELRGDPARASPPCGPDAVTVAAFFQTWTRMLDAEVIDNHIRARTAADYKANVSRHVLPRWGARSLSGVRASDIRLLSTELAEAGLSANSRRLVIASVKRMLLAAAEDKLFDKDRALAVRAPVGEVQRVREALSVAQARLLLADMTRPDQTHPAATLIALGLLSGARRSELAGARWSDLTGNVWKIQRSVTETGGVLVVSPPKTKRSTREVTLPPVVMTALAATRRANPFSTYIAEDPRRPGEPIHPDRISSFYRSRSKRLGLPQATHVLRRTYATQLLDVSGGDLAAVSEALGHASPAFTALVYITNNGNRAANAAAQFAERIAAS